MRLTRTFRGTRDIIRRMKRSRKSGPYTSSTGAGGVYITNREYIKDINGSVGWASEMFKIQAGDRRTFKWLNKVASQFEEYKITRMSFEFRSLSSSTVAQPTPSLGSVIMATDYNPYNKPFVGKAEMENYVGAQSCKPSLSMRHYIKTHENHNTVTHLYVNPDASTPPGADIRLYDLGNFQIATIGQQNTSPVGELWVSYSILLKRPKIRDTVTSMNYARWKYAEDTIGPIWGPAINTLFGTLSAPEAAIGPALTIAPSQSSGWASANTRTPFLVTGTAAAVIPGQGTFVQGRMYMPMGCLKDEIYVFTAYIEGTIAIADADWHSAVNVGTNLEFWRVFGAWNIAYPNEIGNNYIQESVDHTGAGTNSLSLQICFKIRHTVTYDNWEQSWLSPVSPGNTPINPCTQAKWTVEQLPSTSQFIMGENVKAVRTAY